MWTGISSEAVVVAKSVEEAPIGSGITIVSQIKQQLRAQIPWKLWSGAHKFSIKLGSRGRFCSEDEESLMIALLQILIF